MKTRTLCLLVLFLAACRTGGTAPPAPKPEPVALPDWAHLDSSKCAECHAAIAAEWASSMHAASTLEKDPLYRHLYERARTVNPKLEKGCKRCHYPAWNDAATAAGIPVEGVSCVVCHQLSPEHPEPMADGRVAALAVGGGTAEGLCLTCHGELKTPAGIEVCTTGAEAQAAAAGSCIDCHLPAVAGAPYDGADATTHRAHRFPGGHDANMLRGAATLSLEREGEEVVVAVRPNHIGHALPTGNPLRHLVAVVEATAADGSVVWRNVPEAGLPFDVPGALMMKVFTGEDGTRPVPPFLASGPATDTRLQPGEVRTLRYPVPEGATAIRAKLVYRLAPPPLLAAAGAPESWSAPVVVAEAGLDL